MNRISVVIPTHDRAGLLAAAVRSALDQTRPPNEVIVVDDGSTDETPTVCKGFPDPVRCIRQRNAGVSAARNRGVREASGDLIAFLDSDDLWEPNKLEVQGAMFSQMRGIGWSICDSTIVDDQYLPWPGTQGFARGFGVFSELGLRPEQFFALELDRSEIEVGGHEYPVFRGLARRLLFYGNFVQPTALMVRRELFLQAGGFDGSCDPAEDTDFALRFSGNAKIGILMARLARWRIGQHVSLVSPDSAARLTMIALGSIERTAATGGALSPPEREAYEWGRKRLWERLAYIHLSNLDGEAARAALKEARDRGIRPSPKSLLIAAAARLPSPVLNLLHGIKRAAARSLGTGRR